MTSNFNFISRLWFLVTGCLISCSLIGCQPGSESSSKDWPFTPEVEQFAEVYWENYSQRLMDWVGDDETLKPEESLENFEVAEGLDIELIASEPLITQPIDMHFDARGRLWIVQYKQYPFPAGVTINFYDQYLRAGYDGVPSPPPNHVKGADKITVLEDTNGDGVFDSHKDVITGLNITTSVLVSHGGVWVMNPPYLLFYPDHDGDGLPDGDPEVHLEGFGLEDTHAIANSLTLGPDGWIYGVQGSTSTAEVKGISFLGQVAWRYHPELGDFELFSEGGGNSFELDFDRRGRLFTGTNHSGRGHHRVQGGRYEKGWSKHGPLTTPYSFGYFHQMDHEGYMARFSMTFAIYEEGKLPGYEGQHISGMALTNRIQASRFLTDGSTFSTIDTDSLVTTPDRGFRPVGTTVGPDGAVYFADWCDIRMNHVQPVDTWDKSCGRIWRLQAEGHQPIAPFDLTELSNEQLIELLSDERKWYRGQARRLLGERADASVVPSLRQLIENQTGQIALEALWTINLIEGIDHDWALDLLDHPNEFVRYWTIRLLGDTGSINPEIRERMVGLARNEPNAEVRSQLASTSKRLPAEDALPILREQMTRSEDVEDKHIPLLIWWALEAKIETDPDSVIAFLESPDVWQTPIFEEHLARRVARRFAAERGDNPSFTRIDPYDDWMEYANYPSSRMPGGKGDYTSWETNYTPGISDKNLNYLATLFDLAPNASLIDELLDGAEAGLSQGPAVEKVPQSLMAAIERLWNEPVKSNTLIMVAARLGHAEAREEALAMVTDSDFGEVDAQMAALVKLEQGEQYYLTHCATCHQVDGSGMEGMAAPLINSKWVNGREETLSRIVLHGKQGEMLMPAMGTLKDEEISSILTYIRSEWGEDSGPVSAETVNKVRIETEGRDKEWTEEELTASEAIK
ncbi:MAG: PVC-type heme-binding CxxCH protein [Balneolales bacterium]